MPFLLSPPKGLATPQKFSWILTALTLQTVTYCYTQTAYGVVWMTCLIKNVFLQSPIARKKNLLCQRGWPLPFNFIKQTNKRENFTGMSREMFIISSVKPDGLPLATQHQLHSTLEIKSVHHEKKPVKYSSKSVIYRSNVNSKTVKEVCLLTYFVK